MTRDDQGRYWLPDEMPDAPAALLPPCEARLTRAGRSRETSNRTRPRSAPSSPGSVARASAPRAACGSGAAMARHRGPRPRRDRPDPATAPSDRRRGRRSRPTGPPPRPRAAGTVSMRRSSGSTSATSSQRKRARDAGVRHRADRIGRGHRAVAGVLVVVDEHAVALLLPPLGGGKVGHPPLDLAGECQRRAAHLGEVVLGRGSAR